MDRGRLKLADFLVEDERRRIMNWLSEIDMETVHDKIFAGKHDGTAEWLLQEQLFGEWVNARQSTLLWCFGGRGLSLTLLSGFESFARLTIAAAGIGKS